MNILSLQKKLIIIQNLDNSWEKLIMMIENDKIRMEFNSFFKIL